MLLCFPGRRFNLALDRNGGSCTASDEETPCTRAIDGLEDPESGSWLTEREKPQHWIRVDFASTDVVHIVELLQHCSQVDQARVIQLEFSDRARQTVILGFSFKTVKIGVR